MQHQSPATPDTIAALPFAAPVEPNRRLLLFCVRRMGAHGLYDAHAAHAMFSHFGISSQRPLVMLRAFLAETARVAARKISIVGCCCARMTKDEARLIEAIASSESDMCGAHLLLRQTLNNQHSLGALGAAQAIQAAFADLGRPLEGS